MTSFIRYKEGYKYQLVKEFTIQTRVVGFSAQTDFICLYSDGRLVVKNGYAWDGATGVPDLKNIMKGSLAHDALYQLIRMGLIPEKCKKYADLTLMDICESDGVNPVLAYVVLKGVEAFGSYGLGPEREIKTAP